MGLAPRSAGIWSGDAGISGNRIIQVVNLLEGPQIGSILLVGLFAGFWALRRNRLRQGRWNGVAGRR